MPAQPLDGQAWRPPHGGVQSSPAPSANARAIPIGLMALAGFTTGSGMRVLDPLLPAVAAEFGTSVAGATGVVAAFLLPYGLGQVGFGPLGDRFGKPRVACVALLLYALGMLACLAAFTLPVLLGLRGATGLLAGAVIPLLMAHVGDSVPYAERQATIGRFLTGMVMAQIITGPVAGVIAEYAGWRAPFVVLGLLALGAGLAMVARLGPGLWQAGGGTGRSGLGLQAYAGLAAKPRGRWLLLAAFLDGFLLFGGAFPFVGAYLIEDFALSAAQAGLVVAGFGLGALLYTRLARRLVARFGERRLLLAGGAGLTLGVGGLALAPAWPMVAALQLWLGLTFYMFHGVLQARATEVLPEARGTAVSAFAMALFIGQSLGSLAFGLAMAFGGYRLAFLAAAAGVLATAAWMRRDMPLAGGTRGFS